MARELTDLYLSQRAWQQAAEMLHAMAERELGMGFSVHGGGIDLVFPHHENEIAQSEGAHGAPFARIWMHNEMLELSDSKMSKSIGNIALLADVVDRWGAETVIAYFMQSHYRSRLPFSDERLGDAEAACERIGFIFDTFPDGKVFVSVSGGKDSEVLAYLTLLGRETRAGLEWYPTGRLLGWIAATAAIAFIAIAVLSSPNHATFDSLA